MRTNTKVGSALPSTKPSLPRGTLRGNPRTSPKTPPFFRIFFVSKGLVYLEKWMRSISLYGTGRPSRGTAYASGIRHPPHHPTPKLLMNAKFLAEVYLSHIREHENLVTKMVCTNSRGLERPALSVYINLSFRIETCLRQIANPTTWAPRATDFLQVSLSVACTLEGHPRGLHPRRPPSGLHPRSRQMRSANSSPMLGTFNIYVASILKFQALCT